MNRLAPWLRRRCAVLLQTGAPAGQVAWGAGFGMFIALLPTVGQLYMLPPLWAAARYFLRRAFHLPMAYAMVLLINPPLKLFTFYGYYLTGLRLLRYLGMPESEPGFAAFKAALLGEDSDWLTGSVRAGYLALRHFGPPIIAGGILWAAAGGLLAYAAAWAALTAWRRTAERPGAAAPQVSEP